MLCSTITSSEILFRTRSLSVGQEGRRMLRHHALVAARDHRSRQALVVVHETNDLYFAGQR